MITIEVDADVLKKLAEIAVPFKETSPNLVIRRLLGMPLEDTRSSNQTSFQHIEKTTKNSQTQLPIQKGQKDLGENSTRINSLRSVSSDTHPSFLTFLMDKYHNTKGNYKTSDIIKFMENCNLQLSNGSFRNPWMKAPYRGDKNGLDSCQRTIEHFKQPRKFGCWGGKDKKENCDAIYECKYHPGSDTKIKNKCDLRKGVIWKRLSPNSPFTYGKYSIEVVKKQLLNGHAVPLKPLLAVIFPADKYDGDLVEKFKSVFHFDDNELNKLFLK